VNSKNETQEWPLGRTRNVNGSAFIDERRGLKKKTVRKGVIGGDWGRECNYLGTVDWMDCAGFLVSGKNWVKKQKEWEERNCRKKAP